ncbi:MULTISPECIES: macrolide family glycosyltransferase [unclassified Streptomyces]|uniref:macrolide family glycosyltransferase n=1 Tax=unclassified Streptomyces TaxID=2593676 RepID=UPI003433C9BA
MSQHFLFLVIPDHGHIFPNLAILEELTRRGHRVTFVTGEEVSEPVRATGATVLPYASEYRSLNHFESVNEDLGSRMLTLLIDESAAMLRAVEAALDGDRPDVVVYDFATSHAGRILERKWGLPAVQLCPAFAQNEKFSFASGFNESDTGGVADYAAPPVMVEAINKLVAEHGLDVPFHEFFLSIAASNLVFLPKEFQIHGESFDERFSFVGPCISDRSFLGEWQPPASGLPVVLVSLGATFSDVTGFFDAGMKAFADAPFHVVLTLGSSMAPEELGELPANIEAHRWVSHVAVLEHAKAFVTHGGMGSVMDSLSAGVPMVMVPHSPLDRPTGRRVTELGLGEVIAPDDLTAEALRDAVTRLLADEETADRARAMREPVREAGGAARAADVLERTAAPRA